LLLEIFAARHHSLFSTDHAPLARVRAEHRKMLKGPSSVKTVLLQRRSLSEFDDEASALAMAELQETGFGSSVASVEADSKRAQQNAASAPLASDARLIKSYLPVSRLALRSFEPSVADSTLEQVMRADSRGGFLSWCFACVPRLRHTSTGAGGCRGKNQCEKADARKESGRKKRL